MSIDNPFTFSLEESVNLNKSILEIVGQDYLTCVEDAIRVYLIKRRFYEKRKPIPQMNNELVRVREYITALTSLLNDEQLRDYILSKATEHFGVQSRKELTGSLTNFVNRTGKLNIVGELEKIDRYCQELISDTAPKRGRPKGSHDEAIHDLVNNLYRCCEKANNGPITTKDNNMLARLIEVISIPLGLGGNLPGLTKKVILKHRKKHDKTQKNS